MKKWGIGILVLLGAAIAAYGFSPDVRSVTAKTVQKAQSGELRRTLAVKIQNQRRAFALWRNPPANDTDYWQVEDAAARAALPLFKHLPAPDPNSLPASTNWPDAAVYSHWQRSGGNHAANRYGPQTQITPDTIAKLEQAWLFETPSHAANIQANPVYAGGMIFTPTADHRITALDPKTGGVIWQFDPKQRFPAKRGLIWHQPDTGPPALYFPAGAWLYALNAETGRPHPNFRRARLGAAAVIAPVIAGNTLIQPTLEPAVVALDLATGKRLWHRSLVPENLPPSAGGHPSAYTGGRAWGGMSLDPSRGIAYVTTSNPGPVLDGTARHGDNPLSSSVVALDVKSGEILWSAQDIAHDLWDLDIGAPPVLTTITMDSRRVDVVVAATKSGNTLVLERETGQRVFPHRWRRAPSSLIAGEQTAPYQPDPELPEPFARSAFTPDQITDLSQASTAAVAKAMQSKTYGFYPPHVPNRETVFFGLHGGAMWPGPAIDPASGVMFVAANDVPSISGLATVAPIADEAQLPITKGRAVYLANCAGCHGSNRAGQGLTQEALAPPLRWIGSRHTAQTLAPIIAGGLRAMPAITLPPADQDALIEYLMTRDAALQSAGAATSPASAHQYRRLPYAKFKDPDGYPAAKPPWGTLTALDLNTGKIRWQVPLGIHPELTARGIPPTGTQNMGAPLVTATGLVFVAGTTDKLIRAFDARSGAELWSHPLPFVASGPPTSFLHDGAQYIVVPATGGGTLALYDPRIETGSAFVAFRLTP